MKISEIQSVPAEQTEINGVEVDELCLSIPNHIKSIGLKWKGQPKSLHEDVIDTIIQCGLMGVEVKLEVYPDDDFDADYLMKLATNAGFDISIMWEEGKSDAWIRNCGKFAEHYFYQKNFNREVIPMTGFLSYLFAEHAAGKTILIPTDPYVVKYFYEPIPEHTSDAAKDAMRAKFYEALGGKEKFNAFLEAILVSIHKETDRILSGSSQIYPNG